jgi:HEAT repeat protein
LLFLVAAGALWSEPALTNEAVADLEMQLMEGEPSEAAKLLTPYLPKPDPRLAPLIADVLANGESIPVETRDEMFQALLPMADARVFKAASRMLESEDVDLLQKGVQLMGRTKNAKAAALLLSLYNTKADKNLRLPILTALGDLGDASALPFLSQTLKTEQDDALRSEAIITSVRLGSNQGLKEIVGLYARLVEKIYEISTIMSWLSHADPKSHRQRLRDLAEMKQQVARIDAAFPIASTKHTKEVLELLLQVSRPEELDVFYPHLGTLLKATPPEDAVRLAQHSSSVLALKAMQHLAAQGEAAQAALAGAANRLWESDDPFLRERAIRLALFLAAEPREKLVRNGLGDPVFRCREAALEVCASLSPERRKELLQGFCDREPSLRLRDTARWLAAIPTAKVALP